MEPKTFVTRAKLPFGVGLSLAILVMLLDSLNWPMLKFTNVYANKGFIDLASVLHHVDCYRNVGASVYLDGKYNSCGGYWYGEQLLQLASWLGISSTNVRIIAFILIVLFGTTLGLFFQNLCGNKVTRAEWRIFVLTFVSPPLFLLLQRGNLDLLIISLTIIAILMQDKLRGWFTFLVLSLATLFKFYSFPALFLSNFAFKRKTDRFLGIVFTITILFLTYHSYRKVVWPALVNQDPNNSFGLRFLSVWVNYTETIVVSNPERLALDILAVGLGISFFAIVKTRNLIVIPKTNSYSTLMVATYLGVFFVSMSPDYRLVLLQLVYLSLILELNKSGQREAANLYFYMIFIISWLTYPAGKLQIVGDFLAMISAIFLLYTMLRLSYMKIMKLDA
jgi:hypothetical protein